MIPTEVNILLVSISSLQSIRIQKLTQSFDEGCYLKDRFLTAFIKLLLGDFINKTAINKQKTHPKLR